MNAGMRLPCIIAFVLTTPMCCSTAHVRCSRVAVSWKVLGGARWTDVSRVTRRACKTVGEVSQVPSVWLSRLPRAPRAYSPPLARFGGVLSYRKFPCLSRCPTRGHLDPRLLQYPSASGATSSAQYCLCLYSLWIVREARATLRPWRRCEARPVAANIGSRRAAPAPPARAAATS